MTGVLQWMLAWLVMIVLLYILASNRWGHTIIYYGAWCVVVFLVVSNYQNITNILNNGNL